VTFGKAVANGFSFSFLAGRRDIMELGGLRHAKRRVFLLSQTHASETTGLAACMATVKECARLDTTRHVWTTGKRLVEGFRSLANSERVEQFVRIVGFDCNPQIVCTRDTGEYWPELSAVFHEELISHGVLIPWISITQSHGEKELAKTFDALAHGMRQVRDAIDAGRVASAFEGDAPKPVFRPFNKCKQARCGAVDTTAPQLDCCKAST
jgi:glutamate-1-semialdehyde 2,1-aminomutase